MPDPITNQNLYGGTSSPPTNPPPPAQEPIPVEETPEVPMDTIPEAPPPQPMPVAPPPPPPPPMTRSSKNSSVLVVVMLVILFVAGILLSGYIRPFLTNVRTGLTNAPTPTTSAAILTPTDPFAGWRVFTADGLSYKLPPDVLAPMCDGETCVSQGTYLPGGTRFTIAPKAVTQALSSLYGAAITDAGGLAFTSHDARVSGHMAIEYTGEFSGRTSGGYGFTQMHGFMIEVSPTITLEVNHFTPTGVTADFEKDEALFSQIISTLSFTSGSAILTATPIPATTSGY